MPMIASAFRKITLSTRLPTKHVADGGNPSTNIVISAKSGSPFVDFISPSSGIGQPAFRGNDSDGVS
jgi:hypothetical protein